MGGRHLKIRPFVPSSLPGVCTGSRLSLRIFIDAQALEKRTGELKHKQAQMAMVESKVEELTAKHAYFETVAARLEALELRNNHSIQITVEKSLGANLWQK